MMKKMNKIEIYTFSFSNLEKVSLSYRVHLAIEYQRDVHMISRLLHSSAFVFIGLPYVQVAILNLLTYKVLVQGYQCLLLLVLQCMGVSKTPTVLLIP